MFEVKKIEKPWGMEELLCVSEFYVMKRLTMKRGHRCSLQYHVKKNETVYIISGELKVTIGEGASVMKPGDFLTILPGTIHRMEGLSDCVYLEASTTELDDVVRLSDDYKR